ncbi:MAG: transposase [Labilithrix sp.]|nr:transposase [Labilithrix sp.]
MRRRPVQLELAFRTWGGKRANAGRKRREARRGFVGHGARPRHVERTPVHASARRVAAGPVLREQRVYAELRRVLARSSEKGFRVLHFSVQRDHLHLIVEAEGNLALSRGMQRLLSRAAHAVNAITGRSGKLWRDRYHREDLASPRQVRNAYVYVLFNERKHGAMKRVDGVYQLDRCSSAAWFTGWSPRAAPDGAQLTRAGPSIVSPARSWLATTGWKRRGLLRVDEAPRVPARSTTT